MSERTRIIRNRAHLLFNRENSSPQVTLDNALVDNGMGRFAVSEELRKMYYRRAEGELIAEVCFGVQF